MTGCVDAQVIGRAGGQHHLPEGTVAAASSRRPAALPWRTPRSRVYQRVLPDSPMTAQATMDAMQAYQPLFAKIADGIRKVGRFSDPQQ
jgi:hypothetical protein